MPSAYTRRTQFLNLEVNAPSLWRAGRKLLETSDTIGTFARPAKPIILYEFEGCPFCRKVLSGPRRVLRPMPHDCIECFHLNVDTPPIYYNQVPV